MSWRLERALERAEDQLANDLNNGFISQEDYNEEIRELHRQFREDLEQSAQDAYEHVMDGGW